MPRRKVVTIKMASELSVVLLEDSAAAFAAIERLGVDDVRRACANLQSIRQTTASDADLLPLLAALGTCLPQTPDPGMALNNLDRYLARCAEPRAMVGKLTAEVAALTTLLQLFGTSQYFSELLIAHPEDFETLRSSRGAALHPNEMRRSLAAAMEDVQDVATAARVLRRYRQQQILRIGYGDIITGQGLEVVVDQISHLADVIVDQALNFTRSRLEERLGIARNSAGKHCRFVVIAFGKLGGRELNYSSDIDLMFLYENEGQVEGKRHVSHQEYFSRLGGDLTKLLSEHTENGIAYRVDLRLRPEGHRGPVARSIESACAYYDLLGRTWERQALIKARPIAGDLALGAQFLFRMEPWIYRRYLNFAEISGIKALKRRIESRTADAGEDLVEVKTGRGGIRDVEFCTQFLQLLNGGDLPQVRTNSTMNALERLLDVGCLTMQEHAILSETYQFLRKTEHRLQTMFDLQTHRLPEEPRELQKLALRMGYSNTGDSPAATRFLADYRLNARLNRTILNHLLHDAFPEDDHASVEPEVDLVLDPHPEPERIREVLGRYSFRDVDQAYRNLMQLARESIPFLSTPRCRHFLASIAPRLLQALSQTPDPDQTLVNLANVSESLGGKAVLWELFSFNPPSLKLYVDLCAGSQFLTDILISNPGMIDELMDSLVLNQPGSLGELRSELRELCRGATNTGPTLQGFKNTRILHVGVRDILGKNELQDTLGALSDIAEAILHEIALQETGRMLSRWGQPLVEGGPRDGKDCRMAIVALGKLGSRELNYHSDLDVIFLYEADGRTDASEEEAERTTNMHFFSELAQRIIRAASKTGPYGRLYSVDPRLRPAGSSGSIALPLAEFERYFASGEGQLWERQALTRARVVYGEPDFAREVIAAIERAAFAPAWKPGDADEILAMRKRLEPVGPERDLKRGPGSPMDIEFLVQALLLRHAKDQPELRVTNTLEALDRLQAAGHLNADEAAELHRCYGFLGNLTKHLRLMYNTGRARLPETPEELDKLAQRLGYEATAPAAGSSLQTLATASAAESAATTTTTVEQDGTPASQFLADYRATTARTRSLFLAILERLKQTAAAD